LHLIGEVNFDMVRAVLTQLESGTLDTIWLATDGGRVEAALAIYDLIKDRGITVIGTGTVASAGLLVLLGGDTRRATPYTRFMSHPVRAEGSIQYPGPGINEIDRLHQIYKEILTDRSGMTKKQAETMTTTTVYFGVPEAIKWGFLHGAAEINFEMQEAA
jgi:ATP-dependent protease ClpP protease subunit